jgi:hypothetical protein
MDPASQECSESGDIGLGGAGLVGPSEEGVGAGSVETVEPAGSPADFYVHPNGEVVPATGYRYMSANADYLERLGKTMTIPANPKGTFLSFDQFDTPSPDKLQVPHDASVRASFDTLQLLDDLRIPNDNWDRGTRLEPRTSFFREYGPGGATQAITHSSIQVNELDFLHFGRGD